jgi:hypothetical protein
LIQKKLSGQYLGPDDDLSNYKSKKGSVFNRLTSKVSNFFGGSVRDEQSALGFDQDADQSVSIDTILKKSKPFKNNIDREMHLQTFLEA